MLPNLTSLHLRGSSTLTSGPRRNCCSGARRRSSAGVLLAFAVTPQTQDSRRVQRTRCPTGNPKRPTSFSESVDSQSHGRALSGSSAVLQPGYSGRGRHCKPKSSFFDTSSIFCVVDRRRGWFLARDRYPLASRWFPSLWALEITTARRPAKDLLGHSPPHCRDECCQPFVGSATDLRRTAQARSDVGQTTVAKYMARRRRPLSQGWKTFLRNHADAIASIDLFVVPIRGVVIRTKCGAAN